MYTKDSSVADRIKWMENWSKAIEEVLNGTLTQAEASRKYGINAGSISFKVKEIKDKQNAEGK